MIRRAYVQENGSRKLSPESQSLVAGLERRGIPTELFTEKRILRRQLKLSRETLVAGSIPAVTQALQQLEIPVPEPKDYPASLQPFLHRKIWESTVGAVLEGLMQGDLGSVFVKPKGRLKRFTGRVFSSRDDACFLEGASRRLPVYCAHPVEWKSEFRTYVIRGEIVGTLHYWGEAAVRPDESEIRRAVETLQHSGEAAAAYGIDFGVLADGTTALMELNDGFGLGSYGLGDDLYTDLILTRWEELMNQPQNP
jgi:hypothetical protein